MRPHRRQPTRLPSPWDSPGKNTGVGCHFLLQCMKVKSESEVAQSCPTLSDPVDCSPPGSSVHGIFQARVLSRVPLPSPMFQCGSLKSSHPHLLPRSPKVCSLHFCLLCCPACRIVGTIFLNSICIAFGILIPQPGIKPVPLALEARSLNHWTAREVLECYFNIEFKFTI